MCVVAGRQDDLPDGFYTEIANYSYQVFVEQLGWQLQTFNNAEQDQLDRSDTLYVAKRVQLGKISGCTRLLPTTQPYLLGDIFPQLLNGMPPFNSPDVWELSRFAALDFNAKKRVLQGSFLHLLQKRYFIRLPPWQLHRVQSA